MGHEPHDVPGAVADAGHVSRGAVRVRAVDVAEDDLALAFELFEQRVRGEEAALTVLDRDHEPVSNRAARKRRDVAALYLHLDVLTDEGKALVGAESAGQQPRLAEDLEAVANPEYRTPSCRELGHGVHRGRQSCDGATAEVVAVREPAR